MKTVINVKVDRDTKHLARRVAADLGLSLSAVVNAYLKQFVRNKEANFSLALKMSSELEELLGPIEKDIAAGRNFSKSITTAKRLRGYLASL